MREAVLAIAIVLAGWSPFIIVGLVAGPYQMVCALTAGTPCEEPERRP